jgi:hypothetical protein
MLLGKTTIAHGKMTITEVLGSVYLTVYSTNHYFNLWMKSVMD